MSLIKKLFVNIEVYYERSSYIFIAWASKITYDVECFTKENNTKIILTTYMYNYAVCEKNVETSEIEIDELDLYKHVDFLSYPNTQNYKYFFL